MKNKLAGILVLMLLNGDAWSQILVPFVKRYDVTQSGGLVIIGNSMLTCDGSAPVSGSTSCNSGRTQMPPAGTAKDNDYRSAYIDIDGDGSTFSSSSADLSLATCSKITFAGLYWGAYINTGNSNYSRRDEVKLKTPTSGSYINLTADTIYDLNSGYDYYTCFKDVTSIFSAEGNGTFTIADLVARTGGTNQWAGWSIVVVYKNELMSAKNINVFDGLGYVTNSGSSVTVNVNGFYTPPSGAVNFELGEIAYDGDRALTGDSLLFRGNASFLPVSDGLHPANDVFNSTISNFGVQTTTRNPAYSNTLGYDQSIFRPNNVAKNYLTNGATSAQIKVTTGGEQIYLRVLTSAIDTYEPDLAMQKTVSDVNGGVVNPGDTLQYVITVTNTGNDTSSATLITDTLPFNAEYVAGSTVITSGPNTGSKTDAAGDDQAELVNSGGYQIVKIRLGNGANGSSGGQLPHLGAGRSTTLSFRVRITDDCTKLLCDPVISNRANINYTGFISGFPRKGRSNPVLVDSLGCPVDGATNTTINVPVSCSPPPDSSIGGCLPLVFSAIPGIRPGYTYYNSSWVSVTSATVVGNYYGIRPITGTSCADTIRYTVYVVVPTASNAGPDQNLCNATSSVMAGNVPVNGIGTWTLVSGPNVPSFSNPNLPNTALNGLVTGNYVIAWVISTGCNSSSDTLTIINSPLPLTSNAGPNQNLCNLSTVTLAGNSPGAGTGMWTLVSGPNTPTITSPSNQNSTVTGLIAGSYIFRWSISRGSCTPSTSTVQVTVYALPTISSAGADQSICNSTTATLSGNNPVVGTGSWTMVSGPNSPTITAPGSPSSGITGMISGVYVFRWTISNGSCAASTDDVQITIFANSSVANAGSDQSLCNVNTATLSGNTPAAGSGVWSLVSGPNTPTITTPLSPSTTVSGMITGVYTFRWSITNGVCAPSNDNVQVTIFALPTSSSAGPDQNLCNVTSTSLAGNTPAIGTGLWTRISGPNTPTITSPASPTTTLTGMIPGTYVYRWSVTNGVCAVSADDVQINIFALPTSSNAGTDQSLCNVTSTTLSGNNPVVGSGTWSLVSGPNTPLISAPNSANSNVSSLINGVYVFRWTVTSGVCASSVDEVQITVFSPATVSTAGADQELCNVNSATLAGNVPVAGTGLWSLVSGPNVPVINTPSSASSTVSGMTTGIYIFRWTITNGVCSSSTDDVQIIIYALPTASDAGADQDLCNVTTTNLAANTPVVGSGIWSLVSGPNTPVFTSASNPATAVTGMIAGTYVFRWSVTEGVCVTSVDDVQIRIYALPTVSNAGADQTFCNVSSSTFAANNVIIGSGIWTQVSGPSAATITIPASRNSTVTGLIPGVYVFRWTTSSGVCATSSDDMQITNYALPSAADAGADQNLCNVNSVTLAGNSPAIGTGIWTLISGPNIPAIATPSNPSSNVTGMIVGTYVFRWTVTNGTCSSTIDNVQITIFSLPTNSNAGVDQNLCNVSAATLNGNNPVFGTGTWTQLSGPNIVTITTPTSPTTTVTGMIAGTYSFNWSVVSGVCASSDDDVQIVVYDLPTVSDAGPNQDLCNVSSATLAGIVPLTGTGTWTLVSGPNVPIITNVNDPASTVSSMVTGVYVFQWTIVNGVCAASADQVTITIFDNPTTSNAGPNEDLCSVTSVTLAANTASIGTGTWTLVSGPNTPVITSPNNPGSTVTGMIDGTYVFSWSIVNGVCAASTSSVTYTIFNQPTILDAGPDQSICNSASATMAGNTPGLGFGTWILISGPNIPTITSVNDPGTTITGLITGTYLFGWRITNGACSTPLDTVQIINYAVPSTSNAGANQDLCSVTSVTLNGNVPAIGIGSWSFVSGPNIPVISNPLSANSTVTGMVDGIYVFEWSISNGACPPSVSTIQVTIYNSPTVLDAGPDQNLCNVNSVSMAGNIPGVGSGNWAQISGPNVSVIVDPSDPATSVTGMIEGVYYFGWSISNGVCVTPVDTVMIAIYDLPTVAAAGSDQGLCNVDSTNLAGNIVSSGFGNWSILSGPNSPLILDTTNQSSTVTGMISGTYVFVWTISNGVCASSSDTVDVVIYAEPTIANAGADQSLCDIDSVVLDANSAMVGAGTWTIISGPNSPVITDSTDPLSSVSGLIAGNYDFVWSIVNGTCMVSSDSVRVTVYDLPSASNAGINQDICNSSSAVLNATAVGTGNGYWNMISGPNVPSIAVPSSEVSPLSDLIQGTYLFTWTVNNGVCATSVDTVQINVYDLPGFSDAGLDQEWCGDSSITLSANTPSNGIGAWSLLSGPNVPVIIDPVDPNTGVNSMIPGVYLFSWNISSGTCAVSSDDVEITIYEYPPVIDAGTNQFLCNSTTATLAGVIGSVGTSFWSFISGPGTPVITSPSSASTNVTGMMPGIYSFSLNIINGTCAVHSDTVLVSIDASPTVANAGSDQNLCDLNSTMLTGNDALSGTGLWNLISGPNSPAIAYPDSGNTSVTGMISGTYLFSWTISNGVCTNTTDTVQVEIFAAPLSVDAGPDQSLCDTTTTLMGANVPSTGTGTWTYLSGPNLPVLSSVNDPGASVNGLVAGSYIFGWKIDNGVCSTTTDSVLISVFDLPTTANAGMDQEWCNDSVVNMNAINVLSGTGIWSQLSGPVTAFIDDASNPSTIISGLSFGTYLFSWTTSSGSCAISTDSVQIIIYDTPLMADAGSDQTLCISDPLIMAANSPGSGIGWWSVVSGPNVPVFADSTDRFSSVNGLTQGVYVFRWNISNNHVCPNSYDDVEIEIYATPTIANAGVGQSLCNVFVVTLFANTPSYGTGTWNVISGPNSPLINSPSNPNTLVTGLEEGVYIFSWTVSNGPCASSVDYVQVSVDSLPSASASGIDQTICVTDLLNLTGNNPSIGTGIWNSLSGPTIPSIISPSSPVTNVTGFVPGVYQFTWTIQNGICQESTDTVQITVFDSPDIANAGTYQYLCSVDTVFLDGNTPVNGQGIWTFVSGPNTPTILQPDSARGPVVNLLPGTYLFRWTISNGVCNDNYDEVRVVINALPLNTDAGPDQDLCSFDNALLIGSTPAVGTGAWLMVYGPNTPVITTPGIETTTVTGMVQGVYVFRWTITDGVCSGYDEVQVTLNPPPDVQVSRHSFTTCEGRRTVTLQANGALSYLWSPSLNLSDPSIPNPVALLDRPMMYIVTGTDMNGCFAMDTVLVEVCDYIIIPSGFSPDGDGVNDFFEVVGIENYPDNKLSVFNRWGNIVYEKKSYAGSWDAIPNVNSIILGSDKVPAGTYYYILDLGTADKPKSGYLIIRY